MHNTLGSSPALKTITTVIIQKYRERATKSDMTEDIAAEGWAVAWKGIQQAKPPGGRGPGKGIRCKALAPPQIIYQHPHPWGSLSPKLGFVLSILSLTSKLKGASQCQIIAVLERFRLKCKMREPRFSNTYLQKYFSTFQYPSLFAACIFYKLGS